MDQYLYYNAQAILIRGDGRISLLLFPPEWFLPIRTKMEKAIEEVKITLVKTGFYLRLLYLRGYRRPLSSIAWGRKIEAGLFSGDSRGNLDPLYTALH